MIINALQATSCTLIRTSLFFCVCSCREKQGVYVCVKLHCGNLPWKQHVWPALHCAKNIINESWTECAVERSRKRRAQKTNYSNLLQNLSPLTATRSRSTTTWGNMWLHENPGRLRPAPRNARPCVKASARLSLLSPNFSFFLTEFRAVVKCSTVMVTTTVCSRTATSSRTPSFGPEPVITTDCRPVPDQHRPSCSQTSRTRTMAESWLRNFYPLRPLQEEEEAEAGPGLKNKSFSLFEFLLQGLLFHFCAEKTQIGFYGLLWTLISLL